MNNFFLILSLPLLVFLSCTNNDSVQEPIPSPPEFIIGQFEDDYAISYSIADSLFTMEDHTRLHIIEWNMEQQFFIGLNDSLNPYDPLKYSRIDWMEFNGMAPFEWGFCMSAYAAPSPDSARSVVSADREHPMTGCGGYPFSRMKPVNDSM